jgi:F-type H+-transporting ATPase subunit b
LYSFLFIISEVPDGTIVDTTWNFIFALGIQWLNTLILVLVLAKFLYKPVKKFLANRSERISQQLLTASDAEQTALTLKADYEGKLQGIEQERAALIGAAQKNVQEKTEQMLSAARQDAEMLRTRAHKDIKMEQERVKDEFKKEVIDLATTLAGRFAAISLDKRTQDKLIKEAISDIGDIKWLK